MPQEPVSIASNILDFLTTFIPYSVIFGIFWKIIDAILKYANEGRDARTNELIQRATKPLSTNIDKLTESIWALERKINEDRNN